LHLSARSTNKNYPKVKYLRHLRDTYIILGRKKILKNNYDKEHYWDSVAKNIEGRRDLNIIAGDDEPYYRYKRKLFVELLDTLPFEGKVVLEIGCGPGGNLDYLSYKNCKELVGVDISNEMVSLAKKLLQNKNVQILKIDGHSLPFEDNYFDIVFTSTVLQHNTDENELAQLSKSMSRVTNCTLIIFERIESRIKGHTTNLGRPVKYYQDLFGMYGLKLISSKFLQLQASYLVSGVIRKIFNKKSRKEGESISKLAFVLETVTLPVTKLIDKIIPSKRDLAMLVFEKS
jgi:SAM-dependent methyltransferase